MPAERPVVLTRARGDNDGLIASLRALGVPAEERPCIRVAPLDDPSPLRDALAALTEDDLLLITSAAGARAAEAATGGAGCRAPVAAVGAATRAACAAAGLRVAFMPSVPTAKALAEEVPLPRGVVLLARSDRATAEPVELLRQRGAAVRAIVAYRTAPVPLDSAPDDAVVVFASPSAVEGYAAAHTRPRCAIAIGPSTAGRVRALLGCEPVLTSPDDDALLRAIKTAVEVDRVVISG